MNRALPIALTALLAVSLTACADIDPLDNGTQNPEGTFVTELDVFNNSVVEAGVGDVVAVDTRLGLVGILVVTVRAEPLFTSDDWDDVLDAIYLALPEDITGIEMSVVVGGSEEEPSYASAGQAAALYALPPEKVLDDRTLILDIEWLDERFGVPVDPESTEPPASPEG